MIAKELEQSLACTYCRGDLYLDDDTLRCSACAATFEIKNGIPIFMESSELPLFDEKRFERWEGDSSIKTCEAYAENYPYKEFEEPVLNICRGKVLEVGCGSGRVIDKIRRLQNVEWVAGLDPSESMLRKSFEKGFDLVQGVTERLPFKDNFFDRVVSVLYTMEYTERELAYSEIYRVLKPGGYFAFDLLNYFQVIAQEVWYTVQTHRVWNWPEHIRKKSKEQFWHLNIKNINCELKLLRSAGFQIVDLMTTRFLPFLRSRRGISGFWKGRLSTLIGRNIIIICKKAS